MRFRYVSTSRVFIDYKACVSVAEKFRELTIRRENYFNEKYFPPTNEPRELVLGYFTAIVAIDHRTSTPVSEYRATISGVVYKGSDLLHYLGSREYLRNPEYFSAENLSKLSLSEFNRVFSYGSVSLWDAGVRVLLLRDLGRKVLNTYGDFTSLFNVTSISEFKDRLKVFRAYEDPVEKKIFLLAKFLKGRSLLSFTDPENYQVPVDNHLTRIALRLGIVRLTDYSFILKEIEVSPETDIEIRMKIRDAWKTISEISHKDPFLLDDFLWRFGRTICVKKKPSCKECVLKNACRAYELGTHIPEHTFTLTWYY